MSIYTQNLLEKIKRNSELIIKALASLLVIILAVWVFLMVKDIFNPKPIQVDFYPKELTVNLEKPSSVLMTTKIRNTTNKNASNVKVTIEAIDKKSILIGLKSKQEIVLPFIEKDGLRIIKNNVRIIPNKEVIEGEYKIKIRAIINYVEHEYIATLPIKTSKN